ncbi:MAG: hypothetical protein IKH97_03650, partial [Bacteroidales bacterium]|nr:hypothetical protein [Bacteroidales bacterium]
FETACFAAIEANWLVATPLPSPFLFCKDTYNFTMQIYERLNLNNAVQAMYGVATEWAQHRILRSAVTE